MNIIGRLSTNKGGFPSPRPHSFFPRKLLPSFDEENPPFLDAMVVPRKRKQEPTPPSELFGYIEYS
jgi:hypothetical protein